MKQDSKDRKKPTYGYSVHADVDEDDFIHSQSITAGNVYDLQEQDALLLGNDTAIYGRRALI